jgi:hypothetical protein
MRYAEADISAGNAPSAGYCGSQIGFEAREGIADLCP